MKIEQFNSIYIVETNLRRQLRPWWRRQRKMNDKSNNGVETLYNCLYSCFPALGILYAGIHGL